VNRAFNVGNLIQIEAEPRKGSWKDQRSYHHSLNYPCPVTKIIVLFAVQAHRRCREVEMQVAARRLSVLFGTACLLCLTTCASFDMRPIPVDDRSTVSIQTRDLTGTQVDPKFNEALQRVLQDDLLYGVTRKNARWIVTVYQNPFMRAASIEDADFVLNGNLERADYGPTASYAENALLGYMTLGWVGAALATDDSDDYTAALQYRFAFDADDSQQTILVRVARQADVKLTSREDHMRAAAEDAERAFLLELVENLSDRGLTTVTSRRFRASTKRAAAKALKEWVGVEWQG
jgi:hypothetical protein